MATIDETHVRFQELDPVEIIKAGDTTNLSIIKNEVEKIYEWEKQYYEDQAYRAQLPNDIRRSIEGEFENAANQFNYLVNTRNSDIGTFARQAPQFAETIKNYYRGLYDAFVRDYRGWKLEATQDGKLKEIDEIYKEAQKIQGNIRRQEKQINTRAGDVAEVTQDVGLSQLAKYFYQLYAGDNEEIDDNIKPHGLSRVWWGLIKFFRGYRGAARIWLILAVASSVLAYVVADSQLIPFVRDLTTSATLKDGAVIYAVLIAKSLVLAVPIYLIRFCIKNFGSNKQLAADALHKAKTLQTLPAYLASVREDQAAVREVTTGVAQLVFAPTDAGFVAQKGDYDGGITINNPLKPLDPKS